MPQPLWSDFLCGGYPELVADPDRDARLWHASYVQTYLERDVRTLVHRGEEPRLYFWRTSAGTEVDIVVDTGGRLVPIEVKLSATPT
ncbi:MAG: DUF4143 domain-containing protein [Candidatus Latescibacterota bacterium]